MATFDFLILQRSQALQTLLRASPSQSVGDAGESIMKGTFLKRNS